MSDTSLSIVSEVEAAVAAGSPDKCLQTMRRVTALFSASAGNLNDEQIGLFGEVLERLINTIELRSLAEMGARIALAELSAQLAPVARAPASVVRRLARHDEISVAGPLLTESARLNAEDLVEIANTKSEAHLLAISGRWWLKEIVTDALLTRRYPSVSRRLVRNPGARISPAGFAIVLSQAESDPELAVETGIRLDLPADLRRQLLRHATDTVRTRLLSRAPSHLFEEIRNAIAAAAESVDRKMSKAHDFAAAKRLIERLSRERRLNEAALRDFARQRKYEETVTALAELSESTVEIIRPLMQSIRSDGILVPCKVADLGWDTVAAILDCRFSTGATSPDELAKLKCEFVALKAEDAQRLLRLWTIRSPVQPSRLH
jgi:uncharacterized protein (DUF2336 family)